MNDPKTKLPNPFTEQERAHVIDSLEKNQRTYKRAQNQRPEFAEVAKKLEQEIAEIIVKVTRL